MLGNILTATDFEEILISCDFCRGSYGINDFISDIFKKFQKENTNLELRFMEFIEKQFPDIKGIYSLCKMEILNFEEETIQYENYGVEYVYSILLEYADKKYNRKNNGKAPDNIFKSSKPISELTRILEQMKSSQFCYYTDVKKVLWVFGVGKKKASDEKIQWIDSVSKSKKNHQTLFEFLDLFYQSEMRGQPRRLLYRSIDDSFKLSNDELFNEKNIKAVFYSWQASNSSKNIPKRFVELRKIIK